MENKNNKYIAPKAEIILVSAKDIMNKSGDYAEGDNGGYDPFAYLANALDLNNYVD